MSKAAYDERTASTVALSKRRKLIVNVRELLTTLNGKRVAIAYLGGRSVAGVLRYRADHGWLIEPERGEIGHVIDLGRLTEVRRI